MVDLLALEELMRAARQKVALTILSVVFVLVAISSQISLEPTISLEMVLNLSIWALGCLAILMFGALWYRSRARATRRLVEVVAAGDCRIKKLEATRMKMDLIPIGVEVYLEFASGEHLAFGFWTHATARRLLELLLPLCERPGDEMRATDVKRATP